MESGYECYSVILVNDGAGLDQSRSREKEMDSGYILKGQAIKFIDRLEVRCERELLKGLWLKQLDVCNCSLGR